jgi:hypothetical protein
MKVTTSKRLYFQLSVKVRPTSATGFGLLRTPKNSDGTAGGVNRETFEKRKAKKLPMNLRDQIANILPTPTAHQQNTPYKQGGKSTQAFLKTLPTPKSRDSKGKSPFDNQVEMPNILEEIGMKLQPNFVEFMMGYPQNWTNLHIPTEGSE